MVQSHANDDYPVTIGSQVSWYPKAERWRIEVTDPQTMKAVWISRWHQGTLAPMVSRTATLIPVAGARSSVPASLKSEWLWSSAL